MLPERDIQNRLTEPKQATSVVIGHFCGAPADLIGQYGEPAGRASVLLQIMHANRRDE